MTKLQIAPSMVGKNFFARESSDEMIQEDNIIL